MAHFAIIDEAGTVFEAKDIPEGEDPRVYIMYRWKLIKNKRAEDVIFFGKVRLVKIYDEFENQDPKTQIHMLNTEDEVTDGKNEDDKEGV